MDKPCRKGTAAYRPAIHLAAALGAVLLASSVLVQNAFAKTYVIRDGERVVTYTTFATDPAQVLGQVGLALTEYDTYTTEAVDGGEEITICRAQTVTVRYHGEESAVTAFGETAGELLSRLNLELGGDDVTSHALETQVYDGMVLSVDRVVTTQETYTVTVPHEVSYCNDSSLPQGTEMQLIAGQDGQLRRVSQFTYVNGIESGRELLEETVVTPAITEVIALGTGEEPEAQDGPIIADGYIYLPTGEVLTYTDTATIRATAYTHTDAGCDMTTSTGTTVHWGTVAVDPRYILYGTRMFIVSNDGEYVYGIAVAEDCGGDIKGDRMDLYMPTYSECIQFGRRVCTIYFLG